MKHRTVALCVVPAAIIFLWSPLVRAQPPTTPRILWEKSYGGSDNDQGWSIQQTADGGYISAGATGTQNNGDVTGSHGSSDFWILKIDSVGVIQWEKCLGGSGDDNVFSIQQTSDGGYIAAGFADINNGNVTGNHGKWDFWVVRLDASGTLLWQKSLGGSATDQAWSIEQTTDGGFIVAGNSASNNGDVSGFQGGNDTWGGGDYWVVKLYSDGSTQWKKTFGGSDNDAAHSVHQTSDGGYIVAGSSSSTDGDVTGNHGGGDCWVVKLDASGNLVWQKAYGGSGTDNAAAIQPTTDGGYIMFGSSSSNDFDVTGNHGGSDYWVVKLDAAGNISWEKSFGGSGGEAAEDIHQTSDGGYVMCGWNGSSDGDVTGYHGNEDYWIVKIDASGAMQWEKSLGGSATDWAGSVGETKDGGYIVTGLSLSTNGDVTGNHGSEDTWVAKIGWAPIISSFTSLTLPPLICDSIATETVWIHNTGNDTLVLSDITPVGVDASTYSVTQPTTLPAKVAPGDSINVVVVITTNVTGTFADSLRITNNDYVAGHNPWYVKLNATKDRIAFSLTDTVIASQHSDTTINSPISIFRSTGTLNDTITTITRDSGVSWITCQSPALPHAVPPTPPNDTTQLRFRSVAIRDTGWFSTRFKLHVEPCSIDSFVTVKTYLKAGIDSVMPMVTFDSLQCSSQTCKKFWVFNTGNDTLTIQSMQLTGVNASSFGPITPSSVHKIAPKDSFAYTICFTPLVGGSLSATLKIFSDDSIKTNPAITTLTGRKDSADFSFAPGLLVIGDVCLGSRTCLPVTFHNIGMIADTITSITLNSGSGAFAVTAPIPPIPVAVGGTATITVCFTPPGEGNYSATFVVHAEPCGESHAFTVLGQGVRAHLSPLATLIDLGDVRGGNCFDTLVGFVVDGNSPVDISDVPIDQPASILKVISSVPALLHRFLFGDTLWLKIHYCPTCDVTLAANINATATSPAQCPVSASMKVIGHGNCSSLALNRRSITFGTTICGAAESIETFMLTDVGTQSLSVDCKLIGANASDFALDPPATFTLSPNESHSLTLHLNTLSKGVHSATLVITSSDPNHRVDSIVITARVDSAALVTSLQSIDFGDLPSCLVPTDTTIVLWNTGTVVDTVTASTLINFKIISAMPRVINPGKLDSVIVRFDPTVFDVSINEDLFFTSMPCTVIDTVHLRGKADTYTFVPSTIDFGNTQVGDTTCMTVSIVNHNARSVRIRNIIVAPSAEIITNYPALPITIAAHDSIIVNVCYVPIDSTSLLAHLLAFVDSPCNDTIDCTLIGHGIRSDLTATPRPLDFGTLDLCSTKLDSVQLCNRGNTSIAISSLAISGTDAATFALVNTPLLPLTLLPGQCQWIVIRCDTGQRGEGTWRAILTITPQDITLPTQTVNLVVVRSAPVLAVPAVVDFGKVRVDSFTDTTIVLHNTGILPLCIDALTSANEFTIVTTTLPVTLAPGDSIVLKIRFTPKTDSLYSIGVMAHISCPCPEVKTISLFGIGITTPLCTATATLALDLITARVGDIIDVPIHLESQSNIAVCGATDFTYTMRYRRSLMVPSPRQGRDSAEWHIIGPIDGTRTDSTGAIAALRFTVTLGDTEATPIIMESFAWTNGAVATTIVNGNLKIANICPAGGNRLLNADGTFTLAQNSPNPFSSETSFEFETIEKARTRLTIEDVLGRTVAVVVDDELIPGKYRKSINLQTLPSGVYRAMLESAAMRKSVTMVKSR